MLTHFCVHVLYFDSAGYISFGFENVRDVRFYPLYRWYRLVNWNATLVYLYIRYVKRNVMQITRCTKHHNIFYSYIIYDGILWSIRLKCNHERLHQSNSLWALTDTWRRGNPHVMCCFCITQDTCISLMINDPSWIHIKSTFSIVPIFKPDRKRICGQKWSSLRIWPFSATLNAIYF